MDGFLGLLPYLTGAPALLGFVWVVRVATKLDRLWNAAVTQLLEERKDHAQTQRELDAEREHRRKVEDRMNELTWEVRALKAEVARLQSAGPT